MIFNHHSSSPAETERFAREIALWAKPGQCIMLSGDLGSGKSTFARAFIRSLVVDGAEFDVPSPSFSIVQTYDETRVPVAHIDLYRLQSASEMTELGIADLLDRHVLLVEWPDRLESETIPDRLHITFSGSGEFRTLSLQAFGTWSQLLVRNAQINALLAKSAFKNGKRTFLEGDASSRRYESVVTETGSTLLMDMPRRPDGLIVKDNKPYSVIAHLAESISAVVGVNDHLFKHGYSAPEIYDLDLENGLALVEVLGDQVFGNMHVRGEDMREPMMAAADVLADMANRTWPQQVPVRQGPDHHIAAYDASAMLIEADLLPSWYWPHVKGQALSDDTHNAFTAVWQNLIPKLDTTHPVWTLRDYHSPNLMWMPARSGLRRVGLIDTQDCVMGNAAYDLVSMLQDARVDIDFRFADDLFEYYCEQRSAGRDFDRKVLERDFAILGAQRATKILGIFARLYKRDGKPGYLKHIPRVQRYLARNLQHPELAALKDWHDRYLPVT
jgi:N-acetylmuramate 1-kinase